MGLWSSLVLGILKGETKIGLLSKLNWWLFKGSWEPNYDIIVEILFWTIYVCFIANWCHFSSLKVMSFLYISLKNQWKKMVIFFWFM